MDEIQRNDDPWDMLPEETTKAYEAFGIFRDLGPSRTRRATAEQLGISPLSLKLWNTNHAWDERARAYDQELDRARRVVLESERLAMRQRHASQAVILQRKVAERIAAMDPMEMTPKDTLLALDLSSKLERISRGEADARVELTGANNGPIELVEALSPADRAAMMAKVQAEIAKRMGTGSAGALAELEQVYDAEVVNDGGAE